MSQMTTPTVRRPDVGSGVAHGPLTAAAATPLVRLRDAVGEHIPPGLGHLEYSLVERAEQVDSARVTNRARRTVARARRGLPDGLCDNSHLEKFQRLSGHRANSLDADHTVICEEPP